MVYKNMKIIEEFTWGKFVVLGKEHSESEDGRVGAGKDIRILGDVVTKWKERKGHELTLEMITGIFDHGIDILVIGLGWYGALTCPEAVEQAILHHGITQLILLKTPEACQEYNRLVSEGKKAALLAHGTC